MIDVLKKHSFFVEKSIESCVLLENQGYCNENYLVRASGVRYIVRKLLREDIDRDFEWKVHSLAFKEGITAEPWVFDVSNGFMVFEFLEGEHKEVKSDLTGLALTLQKLHSIDIDAKPIELHIKTKTDEVEKAFKTIDIYEKDYVLCHNDLNPQNIFFANDVKFIDWEYSGINDRYFDLACICVEFKLDDGVQEVFLAAYFKDEDFVPEKLEAYKVIYTVLCEEWFSSSI